MRRYGPSARALLRAYALASATQLRLASLYDSRWDFTLYGEGFLALQGDYTKYISVDQLIRQPVMDPDYVSVADFVDAARRGAPKAAGHVTPPALADRLERDNREALRLTGAIDAKGDVSLLYEVADVETWAHLGLHLAEKVACAARSRCTLSVRAAATSRRLAPSPTWSAPSPTGTRSCASPAPSTAT